LRLTQRPHVLNQRIRINQFVHRNAAGFGFAAAVAAQFFVAFVQMLGQFFDDFRFAASVQIQVGEALAQMVSPVRHGSCS